MQRWPAVPTAAKAVARIASSRSATRRDDDGIVAAQLEEGPAEPAADDLADAPAHPAATRRRDQRKR